MKTKENQRRFLIITILLIVILVVLGFILNMTVWPRSKEVGIPQTNNATTTDAIATSTVGLIEDEVKIVEEKKFKYLEVMSGCGIHSEGVCVNMRSGPSIEYPVVLGLRTGIVLSIGETVKGEDGLEWHKIQFVNKLHYPERVKSDLYVADSVVRTFYNEGNKTKVDTSNGPITKKIIIDLSEQMIYAYDGDTLFMKDLVSTGLKLTPTKVGTYSIFKKTPSRYMQGADDGPADQYYDLPGVPWNLYFTYDGDVIHGAYWHNNFGRTWSHGCVNMEPQNAKKLYDWAVVGTPVIVQN